MRNGTIFNLEQLGLTFSGLCLGICLTLAWLLWRFIRSIHELIQQVLNDVGEEFANIFEKPNVKRSMSIIGQKSGEVRADDALRNKVANKVLGESPVAKAILDRFDISPIEGLKLLNDPLLKPIIAGFIQNNGQRGNRGLPLLGGGSTRSNRGGRM